MNGAQSAAVVTLYPATETRTVQTRAINDERRGRKYLTRDEVHRLIKAAKDGRHGPRDALMIRLAYEHGLRVSELTGLRWQAFNLTTHELTVTRSKGSVDGTHPLQGETIRALKRYQGGTGQTSGFAFVNERGGRLASMAFDECSVGSLSEYSGPLGTLTHYATPAVCTSSTVASICEQSRRTWATPTFRTQWPIRL